MLSLSFASPVLFIIIVLHINLYIPLEACKHYKHKIVYSNIFKHYVEKNFSVVIILTSIKESYYYYYYF